ncbi:Mismatch repair ATPase MSH6 (MutS family) [Trachipleistophora hominis]|uniref:Mismatch repair ATPase MSH6 (MutS family) n=1 Tax=Trachipleistophora hominis TaxID=72359 RepID=L7JYE2_TRAHO|nr:Mismatch repair ATPase MSH6 (MutS family) [Trachipleistophora hominis]
MEKKQKSLLDFLSSPVKRTRSSIDDSPSSSQKVLHDVSTSQNNESLLSSEIDSLARNTDSTVVTPRRKKNMAEEKRYGFLADIRDSKGRRINDEGYDKSTLFISEQDMNMLTPFEKQFWSIKKNYFDTIVCFKKGKFYELYENDAEIGAKLFDMKIADRVNMRMAGFPVSCFDMWAGRFLEKGYKVARIDQKENMIGKRIREKEEKENRVANTKGREIIERELKEVITAGTVYNYNHIKTAHSVYLAVIKYCEDVSVSILLYDACINEILVKTFYEKLEENVRTVLAQYNIKEIISERKIEGRRVEHPIKGGSAVDFLQKFEINDEYVCFLYLDNYMQFLRRAEFKENVVIKRMADRRDYMVIDSISLANLNIIDEKTSLFNAINHCSTPYGQRLLRQWLLYPLADVTRIEERQEVTSEIEKLEIGAIKEELAAIGDLDRLTGKLNNRNYTVRDLFNLQANLLLACAFLDKFLARTNNSPILTAKFRSYGDVVCELKKNMKEFSDKYTVSENEVKASEKQNDEYTVYTKELSNIECRLKEYLEKQKSRLNCKLLSYKDLGKEIFQIEVPSTISVPTSYFLVSSTKTAKRYYTQDLKDLVNEHNECSERIFQAKGLILIRATQKFLESYSLFYKISDMLSEIDCFLSFATFSQVNTNTAYTKFTGNLAFENLRNPIFPNYLGNDFEFKDSKTLLLTGPNMAGKSTFLRTICLNVILSQMGMKVTADRMDSRVFDRIFTRLGASDNLLRGESTFMVEMKETGVILNECTPDSLIIIDELGRGTSTKDGESIARAVIEYLNRRNIYSLFSTHYHRIVDKVQNVRKGFMDAIVDDDDIIFLFKLREGVCYDSQGIPVARLAGVPKFITDRAIEVRTKILDGKAENGEEETNYY